MLNIISNACVQPRNYSYITFGLGLGVRVLGFREGAFTVTIFNGECNGRFRV